MSGRVHFYQTVMMAALFAAGWIVIPVTVGAGSPETDLAAPGAPLYDLALTESVKSLMTEQEKAEAGIKGRPPSPGPDYYWCENCKAYHKKKAPAAPVQPAAQSGTVQTRPQQTGATRPPSPGPDYYWCESCNAYHHRQAQQPGAAHAQPAGIKGSGEYYYCENCKAYHRRQSIPLHTVSTNSPFQSVTNALHKSTPVAQ